MIVQKPFQLGDRTLVRTHSDSGMSVHKIGTDEIYDEAIDIYPCPYEYEEVAPEDESMQ